MSPHCGDEEEVLAQVVAENVEDAQQHLQTTQHGYDMAKNTYDMLVEKEWNATMEYANIPVKHPSHKIKADELMRIKSQLEQSLTTMETHNTTIDSLQRQLMKVGRLTPPSLEDDASSDSDLEEGGEDMQIDDQEGEEAQAEDDQGGELSEAGLQRQMEDMQEGSQPESAPQAETPPAPAVSHSHTNEGKADDLGEITANDNLILDGDRRATAGKETPSTQIVGTLAKVSMDSPSAKIREDQAKDPHD